MLTGTNLKKNLLETPLLTALQEDFLPLVRLAEPVVEGGAVNIPLRRSRGARATESDTEGTEALTIEQPWGVFRGKVDSVLYEDAKANHFKKLVEKVEVFIFAWEGYTENLTEWIEEMSRQVADKTYLPPLSYGPGERRYVASRHLAAFVYKRLVCNAPAGPLTSALAGGDLWALSDSTGVTVALATPTQIERVIAAVDGLIVGERSRADLFRGRTKALSADLDELIGKVRLVIASTRLPKRCDLVPFL